MIEELADKISVYCVRIQAAREDDREIIAYGLFHILSSTLQITILLIFALIFDMVLEITAYTIGFTSLKRYIGGAHAHKHWICLWGFTFLSFTCCLICGLLPPYLRVYTTMAAATIMLLLVFAKAPIPHPNNPKSAEKLKKFRKISIFSALSQFFIIIIGYLLPSDGVRFYLLCVAMGGLSAAATLILPLSSYKKEGGEIHESNH